MGDKGNDLDPDFAAPSAPSNTRGCFYYGCIFAGILVLLGVVVIGSIGYFAYRGVARFTDTQPQPLPVASLAAEEVRALKEKVEAFEESVEAGRPSSITLTAEQINALIGQDPDLRGRVAVEIPNDRVVGRVSIPLGAVGMPGRYLNGDAEFNVSLANGVLIVTIERLVVKGQPVTGPVMDSLRKENLAKDFYSDPERAKALRNLESLRIADGRITVTARSESEEARPTPEAPPQPGQEPTAPSPAQKPVSGTDASGPEG